MAAFVAFQPGQWHDSVQNELAGMLMQILSHHSSAAPGRMLLQTAGVGSAGVGFGALAFGTCTTSSDGQSNVVKSHRHNAVGHLPRHVNLHQSLLTIGHPAAKQKAAERSWKPPTAGFVKVGGLVWKILEGWVRDPRCLDKFSFYINDRSTACAVRHT